MRSIEWLHMYVADDLGWPLSTLHCLNFYILHCLMHLRNWRSQRLHIWCKGWMCKSQLTDDKLSLIAAWSGHVTHYQIFGASIILLERLNLTWPSLGATKYSLFKPFMRYRGDNWQDLSGLTDERTNGRTNERGGRAARKHNAFADTDG